MPPCATVGFVHSAVRGDEGGERAGFEKIDGTRDKIVVQTETQTAIGAVGAHGAVRERRIADGEIEIRGQFGAREVGR